MQQDRDARAVANAAGQKKASWVLERFFVKINWHEMSFRWQHSGSPLTALTEREYAAAFHHALSRYTKASMSGKYCLRSGLQIQEQ
jgi:hypothetical protein